MAVILSRKGGGSGSGGAPSGPAGGDLTGTYPNPTIGAGTVGTTELASNAVTALHGCRIYNSAVQSIPDSTQTLLTFDTEEFDTDAFHSTGADTSRITIPAGFGGYYACGFYTDWADNAVGVRHARILKNSAEIRASRVATTPPAGQATNPLYGTILALAAGDFIEVTVFQSSGGALNAGSATNFLQSGFWAWIVGV